MDTWKIAKLMSEETKTVFNAPSSRPNSDDVKFGQDTNEAKPWGTCNSKHKVQGWRTRSGDYNDSHAMTDMIIVDFKAQDTDGLFEGDYHSSFASGHGIDWRIKHDGVVKYSGSLSGVYNGATDHWTSSEPYLIDKPGKWVLEYDSIAGGDCGTPSGGWTKVGDFVAKEAHPDCWFEENRKEGADLGTCGECLDGYSENLLGNCVADEEPTNDTNGDDTNGDNGQQGSNVQGGTSTDDDGLPLPAIAIGGVALLLLLVRGRK